MAGLSAAHFLGAAGHDVTVVEMAGSPRSGGVAIDVRAEAIGVADRMGILEQVRADRITVADVYRFVDAAGTEQAVFEPGTEFYDSPGDIEILRDRLLEILMEVVPESVGLRYDTSISSIVDGPDAISVGLSDGSVETFDLVVGADGMHSQVRALTFGPETEHVHHLGSYVAIVKDCHLDPVVGTVVYNSPGRMVGLRGDGDATVMFVAFRSEPLVYDFRSTEDHKRLVVDAFSQEDGWIVPEAMQDVANSQDFYFDSISQVRMPSWSKGRVVLVGDAGYAASFFSGMGTSLAMLGAEALGTELRDDRPLGEALAAYDRRLRSQVDEAQAMAINGVDILFPADAEAIESRNRDFRAARATT